MGQRSSPSQTWTMVLTLLDAVHTVVEAGARDVQLRLKHVTAAELTDEVCKAQAACAARGARPQTANPTRLHPFL